MSNLRPLKVLIVGEAWGENEELRSRTAKSPRPFVGKAGFVLYANMWQAGLIESPVPPPHWKGPRWLDEAWSANPHIALTNVFQMRPGPDSNDLGLLCGPKTADVCHDLPPLDTGKYLLSQHRHHLDRLFAEIEILSPNLVLGVGATSLWALQHTTAIGSLRGRTIVDQSGQKFLFTYHPSAIARRHSLLPIFCADLRKATWEARTPYVERLKREIWTQPTLEDLDLWWKNHGSKSPLISLDIETTRNAQITEIGIASSKTCALHIPFLLATKHGRKISYHTPYWPDQPTEVRAWNFVKKVCASPIPKIGQNFLYDIQYLAKMGILVRNFVHDTMLEHHSLFPGIEKSLGFMASLYTNETEWKSLRRHSNKDEE